MKTICNLKYNQTGRVVAVHGEGHVRKRLFDMGVTPSIEVTLLKCAPLEDPIEILIRGYHLSLRKDEALLVEVEVLE